MTWNERGLDRSRRTLLKGLAGTGGAMLATRWWASGTLDGQAAIDPRVAKIVGDTLAVDMHNHRPGPYAKAGTPVPPDPVIDLMGQLKASGFSALCYCDCVDGSVPRPPQPGEYYEAHRQSLDLVGRLLPKAGVRRALTIADLRTAHSRKEPIVIQNSEGAQWIDGHLERVEEAYKGGLRHLQLMHQVHDLTKPIGDIQNQNPTQFGGLTPFGADVIKECNRLRIVVDLAHGHESTIMGAAKVARQPFVVSHTAMNSQTGRGTVNAGLAARLISPEYAKAVVGTGGVIGVWHLFDTVKAYVTAVKEMADVAGVDHTGIGTDTTIAAPPGGRGTGTNGKWSEQKTGFVYVVVEEMLAQGFRPDDISKILGGNYLRVFEAVTSARG